MRISSVSGNNNFNVSGITDDSKQNTQQTEQLGDVTSQSGASSFVKKKRKSEADKLEEMRYRYQDLMRQLENANAQAKAQSDAIEVRIKCLKIALSIMCGDKVPKEDYKYLAENDIGLYGKAIMMRVEKKNPREHERVSEDEEDSVEGSGGDSGSGESAAVEAIQSEGGEVQAETSGDSTASAE